MKRFIAALAASLLCFALPAQSAEYGKIACATPYCGVIGAAPKATLIQVDPDPFPAVDAGDPQAATVRWSVGLGLKALFDLCATASTTASPMPGDPCVSLPGATVIRSAAGGTTFEDSLKLPATFYRPAAQFYVRTTSIVHLFGRPPAVSYSNRQAFVWPLTMPNLYAHNPELDVSGGMIYLVHPVSNRGPVGAAPSVSRFDVTVCDGLAMLPYHDPEDPGAGTECREDHELYLGRFSVDASVSAIPAGQRQEGRVAIDGLLPPGAHPYGLWLSVWAHADSHGDVDESNELDNARFETLYLQ